MTITADDLPLERVFRWERERSGAAFLTQPFEGGKVRNWTWAEAVSEARRMAAYLKSQAWEPGSRIAILSKNSAWWIMSDLAIWMSGHVSVPVYPSLRAESVRQILEHSGARGCFLGAVEDREAAQAASGVPTIIFPNATGAAGVNWNTAVESATPLDGELVRPADDLATIIYTSGTTGSPKGVMHRFGSFARNAKALANLLPLDGEQRMLSYLPLAHIVERVAVEALSCTLGWHVFFTEGLETFLQDLRRARPTIFLSVPRLLVKFQQGVFAKVPQRKLNALLRIPGLNALLKRRVLHGLGLDTVRFAACGAAPLPVDMLLWYRSLGLPLIEGYGMTETMITHLPRPGDVHPGFVGQALEGVETRLSSENELLVRSAMNMIGYYREPELTATAFTPDGFFKTGDVVVTDSAGQIKITGRIKEQFKTSKGKYVVPAPIESQLMKHPDVEACCLMGAGQPSAFAVVMLSDAARDRCKDAAARKAMDESLAALLESINAGLESFERLSMIVVVDGPWTIANGMLTPTMKIRRGPLEAQYQRRVAEWRGLGKTVVWEGET